MKLVRTDPVEFVVDLDALIKAGWRVAHTYVKFTPRWWWTYITYYAELVSPPPAIDAKELTAQIEQRATALRKLSED